MPSDYANDLMARVGLDTTEWKKGITDLNAGIKHIETGFQATAALMDDWSNNSDGLRKRIESLNDKLALQKNKLDLLKKAYDDEVAANGAGSKAAEELAKKMYATQNEIKRTESSVKSYTDKLDQMGNTAGKVADKLDGFAQKTKTLSTVCTGALAAIGAGLVKAGADADELNTLAKQTGLTVEEIQKFKYASDIIDVELNDITGALRKMTKNMISTSSEVKGAWDTLGVSTTNANGTARDAVTVFYEVLEALSNVRNETDRDQLAMLLFGKSANDLAGIVDDGGQALRELGQEAEGLGLIMSQDAVDGANKFNDAIDSMKAKVTASIGKFFSENAEKLEPAMESLANVIVSVVNAFANMPEGMQKTVVAALAVGAALSPLLSTGSRVASLFKTAGINISGFGGALSTALPVITLVIAVLAQLGIAYDKAKSKIVEGISKQYNSELKYASETYQRETDLLNDKIDQAYEANAAMVKSAQETYEKTIEAAEDYVEESKRLIKEEQKERDKAHKKELERIANERQARKKAVDDANDLANAVLQDQIDAIDAEIEAEEKAKEEAENAQKLKDLQTAVDAARNMTDKRSAEKELAEFIAEQEAKKSASVREELKKQLQEQIDVNNQKADLEKDLVDQELDQQKQLLEDEYEVYKENLDLRLESLETYVEDEKAIAQLALDQAIKTANEEYQNDTENFKIQLQQKTEAYEEYIAHMEQLRETEIENAKPSFGNVHDEFLKQLPFNKIKHTQAEIITQLVIDNSDAPKHLKKAAQSIFEAIFDEILPFATGTSYFKGGLALVNEKGGEILNLPRGTQIIPHDVSMEMARSYGRQTAITNSNTTNTTNNNSYNYGAQQQVNVFEVSGERVATVIQPMVSVGMARSSRSRGRALGVASK